ncbi:MAG: glycosyltransferase [Burkholderiaceae bacterium]|jgi:glycosyltransferase involved in cell wall biosynthesis|nr:glycosyltransferase [Burkholderiaceae bacterium]
MKGLIKNRQAIICILKDKLRVFAADHGVIAVSLLRRLAVVGPRLLYLNLLMMEHRFEHNGPHARRLTALVKKRLPECIEALPKLIGPNPHTFNDNTTYLRAITLRAPRWEGGQVRRGVLLIKFTETFRFFYHNIDIARLMRYFHIVLEPSWSGYCLPEILLWARFPEPIVVQASEPLDRQFLSDLGANLIPTEIGASDWVDHRVFHPLGGEKTFDVIYVANLTPMKRVNVYLRAVSELVRLRPGFRAALVVSSFGGNEQEFAQLLRWYGIGSQLTVLMNQTQSQLNDIINKSRVSILLSRKEGSNKTLFESMFAGTPVILLRNNIGVNKDYINEHTGRLTDESQLVSTILEFVDGRIRTTPREWAIENISAERSTQKLEKVLRDVGMADPAVDAPLFVKMNTPEATYKDADVARRMPNIADVLRNFAASSHFSQAEIDERLQTLFDPVPQSSLDRQALPPDPDVSIL